MLLRKASVSVVIPTYNRLNYLMQTLDSVANQTFSDWECLVCDDGSDDGTVEFVRSVARSDSRFRLIEGERFGLPAGPRNRGIKAATGEWIAFLDDDDLWHPEKLEIQIKLACYHQWDFIAASAIQIRDLDIYPDGENGVISSTSINVRDVDPLRELNPIINSSVLVKTLAIRNAGYLDESPLFRAVEDFELWTRLHASGLVLHLLDTPSLVGYRLNTLSSISSPEKIRTPDVVRQNWAQSVILLKLWNKKGRPAWARCHLTEHLFHSGNLSLWIGDVLSWTRSLRAIYSIEKSVWRLKQACGVLASAGLAYKRKQIKRAANEGLTGARQLSSHALHLANSSERDIDVAQDC